MEKPTPDEQRQLDGLDRDEREVLSTAAGITGPFTLATLEQRTSIKGVSLVQALLRLQHRGLVGMPSAFYDVTPPTPQDTAVVLHDPARRLGELLAAADR